MFIKIIHFCSINQTESGKKFLFIVVDLEHMPIRRFYANEFAVWPKYSFYIMIIIICRLSIGGKNTSFHWLNNNFFRYFFLLKRLIVSVRLHITSTLLLFFLEQKKNRTELWNFLVHSVFAVHHYLSLPLDFLFLYKFI